jgi:hypothetical protein
LGLSLCRADIVVVKNLSPFGTMIYATITGPWM